MLRVELTPVVVRSIIVWHLDSVDSQLLSPDLTGAEHRVHGTSEAAGGSDSCDLPAETLSDLFVRL